MRRGRFQGTYFPTMNQKKTLLLALGWTACTAAAFWAGTHFAGGDSAADREKARKNAGFAAIRDASDAAKAKGPDRDTGNGSTGNAGTLRAGGKPVRALTPKET